MNQKTICAIVRRHDDNAVIAQQSVAIKAYLLGRKSEKSEQDVHEIDTLNARYDHLEAVRQGLQQIKWYSGNQDVKVASANKVRRTRLQFEKEVAHLLISLADNADTHAESSLVELVWHHIRETVTTSPQEVVIKTSISELVSGPAKTEPVPEHATIS